MPADQYPPFPQDIDAPTLAACKKPRHRHSPPQLAALNELFDQNEHPPLEQRTALAERLGMYVRNVMLISVLCHPSAILGRQRPSMPGFKIKGRLPRRGSEEEVLRHTRASL